ncbi:MAG: TlpA family protein disulfide reductase [Aureispira sp.]|nr:TlpA family protein disulfide reductase [Aureispira sp.]
MRYLLFALLMTFTSLTYAQKSFKKVIEENKFTSLEGKELTFTEIIKANKGKVIYIDFWASWCGPCRQEMPSSLKLHKSLHGEDIVFVYISIDKNEVAWERSMNSLKITNKGQHYRRSQEKMTEFLKFFYIYSIPHYMIIGKDSQIANNDALPPSNEKLERQLRKLLKVKAKR